MTLNLRKSVLFGISMAGLAATATCATTDVSPVPVIEKVAHRRDGPPRKILVGTVVSGYDVIFKFPLEKRLQRMDELLDAMDVQAKEKYPGKRLDLVVLTEWFLARPGDTLEQQAVRLSDVSGRIEACARKHGCYLVVPVVLREEGEPVRYSNVAVLIDREGRQKGIYRKVHPTTDLNYVVLEGGITPGRDFPVFDCDFGRLGIQICYDVMFPEGWQALAKEGAEIVAFPSETPVTSRPSMYAMLNRYYVVSATPRDHAAVYNPVGMIEAQATVEGVLVHQIDLSYAITGSPDYGVSLKRMYGDRMGFIYYQGEDNGIWWSNDPKTSIGQMLKGRGYPELDDDTEMERMLIDKIRGGPANIP